MAHTMIVKIKHTTVSLMLQSYAANACTVNAYSAAATFIPLNNNLFVLTMNNGARLFCHLCTKSTYCHFVYNENN